MGRFRPDPSLRLDSRGWSSDRNPAPRTWGIPARAVQLRRSGRFARPCGRIWSLDVRGEELISAGQTGRSRLYLMVAQRALSDVSAEKGFTSIEKFEGRERA